MEGLLSFQFLTYTVLFFILVHLPPLSPLENTWFSICSKSFNCGKKITGITYPFWGNDRPKECGYPGFKLQCDDQENTAIQISDIDYLVLGINLDAEIITVTRKDLGGDEICQFNTTIDNSNIFEYAWSLVNFTFSYPCPPWAGGGGDIPPPAGPFNCRIHGMSLRNGFAIGGNKEGGGRCHASVVVPCRKEFPSGGTIGDLKKLLEQGFDVKWKVDSRHCRECEKLGGHCGYDVDAKEFRCLCPDDQSSSSSSSFNNTCTSGAPAGAGSPGTGITPPGKFASAFPLIFYFLHCYCL